MRPSCLHPESTPRPILAAGMIIADRYRLLRRLGRGAMGEVWAALNVFTGREVALKFISAPGSDLRRRLEREARACGALHHPNVIDIYDLIRADNGDPVLVLQLLDGETLSDLLRRRRRLEPALAALIGRDIASALAAVHALNIVHRDLKPANIFLHREPGGGRPVVKVLDFGVSKRLHGAPTLCTAPGDAIGSVPYMSPEQIRTPAEVDPRSDLWALGVTLFEMLTGHRPFRGELSALVIQILQAEIPRVSQLVRHVDPGLIELVAGCLCRDRERRLGPAEQLARELDRFVSSGDPWIVPAAASPPSARTGAPALTLGEGVRLEDRAGQTLVSFGTTMLAPQPPAPAEAAPGAEADEDEIETLEMRAPGPAPSPRPPPAPPPPRRSTALFAAAAGIVLSGAGGVGLLPLLEEPQRVIARVLPDIQLPPAPVPAPPLAPDARQDDQQPFEGDQDAAPMPGEPVPPATPQTGGRRQRAPAPAPGPAAPEGGCERLKFLERKRCEAGKSSRR